MFRRMGLSFIARGKTHADRQPFAMRLRLAANYQKQQQPACSRLLLKFSVAEAVQLVVAAASTAMETTASTAAEAATATVESAASTKAAAAISARTAAETAAAAIAA